MQQISGAKTALATLDSKSNAASQLASNMQHLLAMPDLLVFTTCVSYPFSAVGMPAIRFPGCEGRLLQGESRTWLLFPNMSCSRMTSPFRIGGGFAINLHMLQWLIRPPYELWACSNVFFISNARTQAIHKANMKNVLHSSLRVFSSRQPCTFMGLRHQSWKQVCSARAFRPAMSNLMRIALWQKRFMPSLLMRKHENHDSTLAETC